MKTERTIADEIRDSHKALADLWQGISAFEKIKNCVTVYGSARFKEGHRYYELARSMGKVLAENGFTVMTGGGPGVMEAANRGAKEGGGISLVVTSYFLLNKNLILMLIRKLSLNSFLHAK